MLLSSLSILSSMFGLPALMLLLLSMLLLLVAWIDEFKKVLVVISARGVDVDRLWTALMLFP